jgi:hypothetical protein
MAELVESSDVETDVVFKVCLGYEDFYLTEDAARELRDRLGAFLTGR